MQNPLKRLFEMALMQRASQDYEFTPEFSNTINTYKPQIVEPFKQQWGGLFSPTYRQEELDDPNAKPVAGIFVDQRMPNKESVLRHEGLHAADFDGLSTNFQQLVDKNVTPEMEEMILSQLRPWLQYNNNEPIPDDISKLPWQYMTEVHSELPEMFLGMQPGPIEGDRGVPLPDPIKQYYSQFFNPDAKQANPYQIGREAGVPIDRIMQQALALRRKPQGKLQPAYRQQGGGGGGGSSW